MLGGGPAAAADRRPPEVVVEVCTCGCTPHADGTAAHPDWPLATAWTFLTRPVESAPAPEAEDAVDPADLPWWDARSQASRRRAVLPLVLLGELQAGVLLRAVWEVLQRGPGGPTA